jgi:hypothetical protein
MCDYLYEKGEEPAAAAVLQKLFDKDGIVPQLSKEDHCDIHKPSEVTKLHVMTVGNKNWPELEILRKSVQNTLGVEVQLQGLGVTYPGHAFKIQQMIAFMATIPDDEHVLFTGTFRQESTHINYPSLPADAYDVVFLQPAIELLERYRDFCAPIVMNSELAIAPDKCMSALLPKPPASHALPYLNCGAFIGQALHIKQMLKGIRADIAANFEIDTMVSTDNAWLTVNDQRWGNGAYGLNMSVTFLVCC